MSPTCRRRLHQRHAEGLGEGAVEEDVAPHQQLAHALVWYRTHQAHPPPEAMLPHHRLQQGALGAVAADQKLQAGRGRGSK